MRKWVIVVGAWSLVSSSSLFAEVVKRERVRLLYLAFNWNAGTTNNSSFKQVTYSDLKKNGPSAIDESHSGAWAMKSFGLSAQFYPARGLGIFEPLGLFASYFVSGPKLSVNRDQCPQISPPIDCSSTGKADVLQWKTESNLGFVYRLPVMQRGQAQFALLFGGGYHGAKATTTDHAKIVLSNVGLSLPGANINSWYFKTGIVVDIKITESMSVYGAVAFEYRKVSADTSYSSNSIVEHDLNIPFSIGMGFF